MKTEAKMEKMFRFDVLMDFARSCMSGYSMRGNEEEAVKWRAIIHEFSGKNLVKNSDDYKKYLQTPRWKDLRNEALRRAKYLCQICASDKKLEVHHRKYPIVFGTEPIEDLTVLCHECHEHWHSK